MVLLTPDPTKPGPSGKPWPITYERDRPNVPVYTEIQFEHIKFVGTQKIPIPKLHFYYKVEHFKQRFSQILLVIQSPPAAAAANPWTIDAWKGNYPSTYPWYNPDGTYTNPNNGKSVTTDNNGISAGWSSQANAFGGEANLLSVLQTKNGGFKPMKDFIIAAAKTMLGEDDYYKAKIGLYSIEFMPLRWLPGSE